MTYSDPKRSFSKAYRREGRRIEPRRRSRARSPNPWVIVGSVFGGLVLIGLVITVVILASKPNSSEQASSPVASDTRASEDKNRSLFPLLTEQAKPSERSSASSSIPGGFREPEQQFIRANRNRIQEQVRAMNTAAFNGDPSAIVDHTLPKLLEFMGGRQNAELAIRTIYLRTRAANLRLESVSFPEDPRYLETDEYYYAVVPVVSVAVANGLRIETSRHYLAILKKGTTDWKYIDGSGTDKRMLQMLVPDLPSHIQFPKASERSL